MTKFKKKVYIKSIVFLIFLIFLWGFLLLVPIINLLILFLFIGPIFPDFVSEFLLFTLLFVPICILGGISIFIGIIRPRIRKLLQDDFSMSHEKWIYNTNKLRRDICQVPHNENLVLVVAGHKIYSEMLKNELNNYAILHYHGLPVPEILEKTKLLNGKPAYIMQKYAQGSKDIVRIIGGIVTLVGTPHHLNQRSVTELKTIKQTIIDKNIRIHDIQFLINYDGRIVITYPADVIIGKVPSHNNIIMIDRLIALASGTPQCIMKITNIYKEIIKMSNIFPEVLYFSGNGRKLLNSLIGQKIVRMFHHYLGNHNEFQDYLHNLLLEIPREQVFSIITGPLLIEFDSGVEMSFFADESMLSIAFWIERNNKGENINCGSFYKPLDYLDRSFIDVNDPEFSTITMRNFLNKKIATIKLYCKDKDSFHSTSNYRIKDSVILFIFEDSQRMVLGYDILDVSSIMTVVPWDSIPADIRNNLFEVYAT
jgi:hypothetical protein